MVRLASIGEDGVTGRQGARGGTQGPPPVAAPGRTGRPRRGGDGGRDPVPWPAILALVALALVALVVAPYLDQAGQLVGPPVRASVADIILEPDDFYDRVVAVAGMVDALVDRRSVSLKDEDPDRAARLAGTLLVVSRERLPPGGGDPAASPFIPGDSLRVIGPVRRFIVANAEREIGDDLHDAAFAPWDGQPVIVATAITRSVGGGPLDLSPTIPPTGGTPGADFARWTDIGSGRSRAGRPKPRPAAARSCPSGPRPEPPARGPRASLTAVD